MLRTARKAACLTQPRLAKRLEKSQGDISLIERGKQEPRMDTLLAMVSACGGRLVIGRKIVTSPRQAYGILRTAMVDQHVTWEGLAAMAAMCVDTLRRWTPGNFCGASAGGVGMALKALGMEMEIEV